MALLLIVLVQFVKLQFKTQLDFPNSILNNIAPAYPKLVQFIKLHQV